MQLKKGNEQLNGDGKRQCATDWLGIFWISGCKLLCFAQPCSSSHGRVMVYILGLGNIGGSDGITYIEVEPHLWEYIA